MTRVLLTGGSGFIAAHTLDVLLERGHSVVTTVRSQAKAEKIKEAHPNIPKSRLDFAIVEDVAQEHAFDNCVVSDPPFGAVIHTASPVNFNIKDIKKEVLDPAILGTIGILKSIKKNAPTVTRVLYLSSFAAMVDISKIDNVDKIFSEADWNPITEAEAYLNPIMAYRGGKTFAERAAWEFVEKENPNFSLTTLCPPVVIGPIVHYLNSPDALNMSSQRIYNLISGKWKEQIPPSGVPSLWIDVRDLALAHVKCIEVEEAVGKRLFTTEGLFSNKEILEIVRRNFPQYAGNLPPLEMKGGEHPETGIYGFDNSRTVDVLGLKFRTLEESVVDSVKSLQSFVA